MNGLRLRWLLTTFPILFGVSFSDQLTSNETSCEEVIFLTGQIVTYFSPTWDKLLPSCVQCPEKPLPKYLILTFRGRTDIYRLAYQICFEPVWMIQCGPSVAVSYAGKTTNISCKHPHIGRKMCSRNTDLQITFESFKCKEYINGFVHIMHKLMFTNTMFLSNRDPCRVGVYSRKSWSSEGTVASQYLPDYYEDSYFCKVEIEASNSKGKEFCVTFDYYKAFSGGAELVIKTHGYQPVMDGVSTGVKYCETWRHFQEVEIMVTHGKYAEQQRYHAFLFHYEIFHEPDPEMVDHTEDEQNENYLLILFMFFILPCLTCCCFCYCKYKKDRPSSNDSEVITQANRIDAPIDHPAFAGMGRYTLPQQRSARPEAHSLSPRSYSPSSSARSCTQQSSQWPQTNSVQQNFHQEPSSYTSSSTRSPRTRSTNEQLSQSPQTDLVEEGLQEEPPPSYQLLFPERM